MVKVILRSWCDTLSWCPWQGFGGGGGRSEQETCTWGWRLWLTRSMLYWAGDGADDRGWRVGPGGMGKGILLGSQSWSCWRVKADIRL